ncbi:MAG: Ca-activated chloride channel family protein [Patescibacteria group bacterium]
MRLQYQKPFNLVTKKRSNAKINKQPSTFLFSFLSLTLVFSSCSKSDEAEYEDSRGAFNTLDASSGGPGGYGGGSINISGESYNDIEDNPFISVAETSVSTFSVDADGASYSNVRRFLNES